MGERLRTGTTRRAARTFTLAATLAAGGLALTSGGARAQFFFWDQPRYSADDAARIALQHGFRPLAQPARNDRVYLADVSDQRGRRERLIISADSGEILQRFYLDDGRRYRRFADPSIPRGPVPPGRIPDDESRSQVTRLAPDDGALDQPDDMAPEDRPPPRQRPARIKRNRAVDQAPDTIHQTPVESAPLAPATPAPAALQPMAPAAPAPAQAALPPAAPAAQPQPAILAPAPVVADKPSRPISHDPLAIPGSREEDQAVARQRGSTEASIGKPIQKPAKAAVPVAPLE